MSTEQDTDADGAEPRRKPGWAAPGPGRPGPGEMVHRRAYELSLARWGDGGKPAERGIGSLRWVAQQLHAEGLTETVAPTSTVAVWVKRGKALREAELEWILDPLVNREKIVADLHTMMGVVDDEYEDGEISAETEKWTTIKSGLLKLLGDIAGAKAATALDINHRMPAGMSERTVATLRATDPTALTDAERHALRAGYDTRRRTGNGGGNGSATP